MRRFASVLCIVLAVGMVNALPQYGQPRPHTQGPAQRNPSSSQRAPAPTGQNLPDGCKIIYKDFNIIVHEEKYEKICTPYTEQVCNLKYRQVCNPYQDTECRTVFKRVCEVKQKQECNNLEREVPEEYEDEECNDELIKACEFHWVIKGGDKVWEEDPNNCKEIPQTQCHQVKKTRTRLEKYTDCQQVPYNDCQNVPDQECRKVTKTRCEQQSYDDCNDVTKQKCENVHKRVPQTKTERKPVKVCSDQYNAATNDGFNGDDSFFNEAAGQFDDVAVVINSAGKSNEAARFGGDDEDKEYDSKFLFSS